MRVEALPLSPDNDMVFESFGGQRHGVTSIPPPRRTPSIRRSTRCRFIRRARSSRPTGCRWRTSITAMTTAARATARDSVVHFTAPADGEYIVQIRDVQGPGRRDLRLSADGAPPRPDFRLTVNPRNPNVPAGGADSADGDGARGWTDSMARST